MPNTWDPNCEAAAQIRAVAQELLSEGAHVSLSSTPIVYMVVRPDLSTDGDQDEAERLDAWLDRQKPVSVAFVSAADVAAVAGTGPRTDKIIKLIIPEPLWERLDSAGRKTLVDWGLCHVATNADGNPTIDRNDFHALYSCMKRGRDLNAVIDGWDDILRQAAKMAPPEELSLFGDDEHADGTRKVAESILARLPRLIRQHEAGDLADSELREALLTAAASLDADAQRKRVETALGSGGNLQMVA